MYLYSIVTQCVALMALQFIAITSGAGYSCLDQQFTALETVTITAGSDSSFIVQNCQFGAGLTVLVNPPSATLTNFALTMTDSTVVGTITLTLNAGSGTTLNISSTRVTGTVSFVMGMERGSVLGLRNVSAAQLAWTGLGSAGKADSVVEVRNCTFVGGGHTIFLTNIPTLGEGSRHRWVGNSITTTTPGNYAMHYSSPSFASGALLEMINNTVVTPQNPNSFSLYVTFSGGTILFDRSNRLINGGPSITATGNMSGAKLYLEGSDFYTVVSINIPQLFDSVLSFSNCVLPALSLFPTVMTRSVLKLENVSNPKGGIAFPSVTALDGTLITLLNSTFTGIIALEVPSTNSTIAVVNCTAQGLRVTASPMTNSTFHVETNLLSGGSHTVYITDSPAASGTIHRYIGNTIQSTVAGNYAMYYASSGFAEGAALVLEGNVLATLPSPYAYAILALLTGGSFRYSATNRIINGAFSLTATESLRGMVVHIVNSTIGVISTVSTTKALIDSTISVEGSVITAEFSVNAGNISNSTLTFQRNQLISATFASTFVVTHSILCFSNNFVRDALTIGWPATAGTVVTVSNSTVSGGMVVSAPFIDASLVLRRSRFFSFYMTSTTFTRSSLLADENVFLGTSHTTWIRDTAIVNNSLHRFFRNTIATTTSGYYALYYLSSAFSSGSRLELFQNSLETPLNPTSLALETTFSGGTIHYDMSNVIKNGGVSIQSTERLENAVIVLSGSYFYGAITITARPFLRSVISVANCTVSSISFPSATLVQSVLEFRNVLLTQLAGVSVDMNSMDSMLTFANSSFAGRLTIAAQVKNSILKVVGCSSAGFYIVSTFTSNSSIEIEGNTFRAPDHTFHVIDTQIWNATMFKLSNNTIITTTAGNSAVYFYASPFTSTASLVMSGNFLSTPASPSSYNLIVTLAGGRLDFHESNRILNGGVSITATDNLVDGSRLQLASSTLVAPVSLLFAGSTADTFDLAVLNCSCGGGIGITAGTIQNSSLAVVNSSLLSVSMTFSGAILNSLVKLEGNQPTTTAIAMSFTSFPFVFQSRIFLRGNTMTEFSPSSAHLNESTFIVSDTTVMGVITLPWSFYRSYALFRNITATGRLFRQSGSNCIDSTWTVAESILISAIDEGALGFNCAFRFLNNTVQGGSGRGLYLSPASESSMIEVQGNVFLTGASLALSGTTDTVNIVGNRFASDPSALITLAAAGGSMDSRIAACNTIGSTGSSADLSLSTATFTNLPCSSTQTYFRCSAAPLAVVSAPVSVTACNTSTPMPQPILVSGVGRNAALEKLAPFLSSLLPDEGLRWESSHTACSGQEKCCVWGDVNTPTVTPSRQSRSKSSVLLLSWSISATSSTSATNSRNATRRTTHPPSADPRNETPSKTLKHIPAPGHTTESRTPPKFSTEELSISRTATNSMFVVLVGRPTAAPRPSSPKSTILPPQAQRVVAGVTVASAALGSLVSFPTVAVQAGRLGAMRQVVWCAFGTDSNLPESSELPIQSPIGDGSFSIYLGAVVANVATFVLSPAILIGIVYSLLRAKTRPAGASSKRSPVLLWLYEKFFTTCFYMGLGYFGPTALKPLILAAMHGGTALELSLLTLSVLVILLLFTALLYAVVRVIPREVRGPHDGAGSRGQEEGTEPPVSPSSSTEDKNGFQSVRQDSLVVETLGPVFDAGKNLQGIVRVYYMEDFALACLLQGLAGIQPASNADCGPLAVTVLCLIVLHLLYLAGVRPYKNPVEQWTTFAGAFILGAMALCGCVLTFASDPPEAAQTAFDALSLIENIYFFVQALIALVDALAMAHKRRIVRQWRSQPLEKEFHSSDTENFGDHGERGVPLLVVVGSTQPDSIELGSGGGRADTYSNPLIKQ